MALAQKIHERLKRSASLHRRRRFTPLDGRDQETGHGSQNFPSDVSMVAKEEVLEEAPGRHSQDLSLLSRSICQALQFRQRPITESVP